MSLFYRFKPYHLLLFTTVLLIIYSFIGTNKTVDLHFSDTYYVLDAKLLCQIIAMLISLFWLLYVATNSFLYSPLLSWPHILFVIGTCLLTIIVTLGQPDSVNTNNDFAEADYLSMRRKNNLFLLMLELFVFSQLFYIVNLTYGVFGRFKKRVTVKQ